MFLNGLKFVREYILLLVNKNHSNMNSRHKVQCLNKPNILEDMTASEMYNLDFYAYPKSLVKNINIQYPRGFDY